MNNILKGKTQVLILATLHKFHKQSKMYTYDDVFKIIDEFNPNVLGVEIRTEDIKQSREYLGNYYPYEMIESLFRWSGLIEVYGFDYYDKSVEGKLIPEGYFENLYVFELENKFENDPLMNKARKTLDICGKKRNEFLDINMTASQLNDGRYDLICDIYYRQLEILLKNTSYEDIANFYKEREKNIDKNIVSIIKNNTGKKLAFMTGADHRGFIINAIKEEFKDTIEIINVK